MGNCRYFTPIYDPGLRFPTTPPHPPAMWWPCPHYPLLQYYVAAPLLSRQKKNIGLQAGTFGVWSSFSCRNKKPPPSNLIGSMMILRVLAIHVPPCYDWGIPEAYSIETIYDLWWSSLHIYHYESHNPHPQGGEGERSRWVHYIGGGPAKPGSYIGVMGPNLYLVFGPTL